MRYTELRGGEFLTTYCGQSLNNKLYMLVIAKTWFEFHH
jgi:hypothetical protein